MRPFSKHKFYINALLILALWMTLIVITPLCMRLTLKRTALFLYLTFSPLCHQLPERSFYFQGYPLAVCSRCFGIYTGLFLGSIVFPFIRGFNFREVIDRRFLVFACFPMAIDVAFITLGVYPSNRWTRFATGLGFGTILAFFALPGFFQMCFLIFRRSWIKNIFKISRGI